VTSVHPSKPILRAIWLIYEGLAAHPELLQQLNEKAANSVPPKIPDITPHPQQ
jgi:hypothetical protein